MAAVDLTGQPANGTHGGDALLRERVQSVLRAERYWLIPAAALFAWLTFMAYVLPIDPDEAVFKIVSTGITHGRWPYRDLWDNKPPLIYVWYLPAGFGASIRVERLIAVCAIVASVPVMARLARRWLPSTRPTYAVVCYCLLLANPLLGMGAHTEAFMLLPLTLAALASSPLIAGALLGVAVMTKPTAIVFAPVLVVLWRRRSWQPGLGTLAVCALVALPFVPIWHDFWTANVTFNHEFSGQVSALERLRTAFELDPGVLIVAFPGVVLAAAGLLIERRLAVVVWLAAAIIGVKSTGLDYGHYYTLAVPPLALMAPVGLDAYAFLRRRFATRMGANFVLACSALLSIVLGVATVVSTATARRPYGELIDAIDGRPGELYVLSDRAQVYALVDRQPERRFFFDIPLVVDAKWADAARTDLLRCPPDMLVIPEHNTYRLDWRGEIAALYRTRQDVYGATLYTEPERNCDHSQASVRQR